MHLLLSSCHSLALFSGHWSFIYLVYDFLFFALFLLYFFFWLCFHNSSIQFTFMGYKFTGYRFL